MLFNFIVLHQWIIEKKLINELTDIPNHRPQWSSMPGSYRQNKSHMNLTWQCILAQGLQPVGNSAVAIGTTVVYLVVGLLLVPQWCLR
jgi:hypothetical protein